MNVLCVRCASCGIGDEVFVPGISTWTSFGVQGGGDKSVWVTGTMLAALRAQQKSTKVESSGGKDRGSSVVAARDLRGNAYDFNVLERKGAEAAAEMAASGDTHRGGLEWAEAGSDGVWRDDEGDMNNLVNTARRHLTATTAMVQLESDLETTQLPLPASVFATEESRLEAMLSSSASLSVEDEGAIRVGKAVVTLRQHVKRIRLVRTAVAIVYELVL